ncbi:MAG TPA: hypothetical protein VF456_11725 [Vicinamibacterales bacterium]
MKAYRFLLTALAVSAASAFLAAQSGPLSTTFTNWVDHPAIAYRSTPAGDPVSQLSQALQSGRIQLTADGPSGYLQSVLKALNVPVESQIVVFARDSVQLARITMNNPRALFFNDSVAVGWVRGGFIELASQDPRNGVIFYAMEPGTLGLGSARLTRRDDCLSCHYSYSTAGVPGMLVRSYEQFAVDHTIPIEKRWGGWYVTGSTGSIPHLGNTDLTELALGHATNTRLNWPSLDGKFDTTGYLSPHSDIVALMVFEHQMHVMNLLTRIGWEARVAEAQRAGTPAFARPGSEEKPIAIDDAAAEVADYMLFVGEPPIADAIRGSSGFRERFEKQGPFDRKGRSLRQLDLSRRLMRYPLSYMIYSPLFEGMPAAAKDAIYRRLWLVLSGGVRDAHLQMLSLTDRQAIVEILQDTKSDLPSYFSRPIS